MARNDKGNEEAGDKKENANPFSATEPKKGADVVRFWSTQSGYTIAVAPGKNAAFKKHALVLESSDPVVSLIRSIRIPDVKEVLNVPFAEDKDAAKFNKLLQKIAFNSETGKVSKRGRVAIQGLFGAEDDVDIGSDTDTLIMRALKTKSFKEGI